MDFKNELFQGQDAYFNENGCYPDIVFVRYYVWCEMFPRSPVPRGKGIDYHGKSYVQLRTCGGPMFQFSDREFMGRACASYCPYMNQLGLAVLELSETPMTRIADWNPNYCTPVAMPAELKTRSISVELMKRWKESF